VRTFPQNFPRKACGTVRATPGFPPRGAAPLAGEWDTRARASQWSRDECGGLFKAASSRASPARLELQGWLYGDCHSASGAWWGGCASLCSTGEPRSGKKATFPSRDSGPDETRAREPLRPLKPMLWGASPSKAQAFWGFAHFTGRSLQNRRQVASQNNPVKRQIRPPRREWPFRAGSEVGQLLGKARGEAT